ncbi:MAG: hypothetical protein IJG36_08785, partial [Synergistaceae bacterium]|nr:hypothetical protein [Synergistaceae bacterium]
LIKGGMKLIEYDNSFFTDVLAIQGVKDLYKRIDTVTNGLASALETSLADMAASKAETAAVKAEAETTE